MTVALALLLLLAVSGVQVVAGVLTINRRADELTMASLLAHARLEQLRALRWAYVPGPDGSLVQVTDTSTDLSTERPAGGGPGLAPSPPSTLVENLPGYTDFLDEAGRWVGNGSAPPAAARYVRRWAVRPFPAEPDAVAILRVHVAVVSRGAGAPASPAGCTLATLKVRRLE